MVSVPLWALKTRVLFIFSHLSLSPSLPVCLPLSLPTSLPPNQPTKHTTQQKNKQTKKPLSPLSFLSPSLPPSLPTSLPPYLPTSLPPSLHLLYHHTGTLIFVYFPYRNVSSLFHDLIARSVWNRRWNTELVLYLSISSHWGKYLWLAKL